MKSLNFVIIMTVLLVSTSMRSSAQILLPEIRIVASTYKYQVHYYESKEKADKVFKLLLENGDKRMKVKLNEMGEFL